MIAKKEDVQQAMDAYRLNINAMDAANWLETLVYEDFLSIQFEIYPGVRTPNWKKMVENLKNDLLNGSYGQVVTAITFCRVLFRKIQAKRESNV